MKSAFLLLITSGLCGVVLADGPTADQADGVGPVNYAGHLYINLSTGERVFFSLGDRTPMIWANTSTPFANYYSIDGRVHSGGRATYGSMVESCGDIAFGAYVDSIDIGYAIDGGVPDPASAGVTGLSIQYWFYDNDNRNNSPGAVYVGAVQVDDIPGDTNLVDASATGYTATIDGITPFILADLTAGSGHDIDADGLGDFGFGVRMVQNTSPKGVCGPLLALPGNAGGTQQPPSAGVADEIDWYNSVDETTGAKLDFKGKWWFGGYNPNANPVVPYCSIYIGLRGSIPVTFCPADFNQDGSVDFFDYDEFVACFEGTTCPPGATADFDLDGAIDFFDYDNFVAAFETPCN
ncbi:MAG: hypothetical protein AABZ53_03985 [Planctomycetota bacterium]